MAYRSASVQLGLIGETVSLESDDTNWWANKVGGDPGYFAQPPDAELLCCRRCQSDLTFIAQLYCPLEGSKYHRLLHVFGCLAAACQGHSERSEMLDSCGESMNVEQQVAQDETEGTSATDWCESADDWDNEFTDMVKTEGNSVDLDRFQAALAIGQTPQGGDDQGLAVRTIENIRYDQTASKPANHRVSVPCFYIEAVPEPSLSCLKSPTSHELELIRRYESEHRVSLQQMDIEQKSGEDNEHYEKAEATHGDQAFRKFHKRIQYCPQQCLRYERSGSPLLISGRKEQQPPEEIPLCPFCKGARVFEMQLMPALVHVLHRSSPVAEHLDFGTVLVYTCSGSCWDPPDIVGSCKFKVEYAFVQSED